MLLNTNRKTHIVDMISISTLNNYCKLHNFIIKSIQTSQSNCWGIFRASYLKDDYNIKRVIKCGNLKQKDNNS